VPPMKRVVAAAQRRTHSGASDSDKERGEGARAVIRTLTQRERTSDSFFDLENWQILKEEGKAVCSLAVQTAPPNCSKLPNCQTAKLRKESCRHRLCLFSCLRKFQATKKSTAALYICRRHSFERSSLGFVRCHGQAGDERGQKE